MKINLEGISFCFSHIHICIMYPCIRKSYTNTRIPIKIKYFAFSLECKYIKKKYDNKTSNKRKQIFMNHDADLLHFVFSTTYNIFHKTFLFFKQFFFYVSIYSHFCFVFFLLLLFYF